MNASSPIISHFDNRTIEWNPITLQALLAELRDERSAHDMAVAVDSAEAEHNALMVKAELVKRETERELQTP
jgi:hypothetical protein